jgi:hypothetical protein
MAIGLIIVPSNRLVRARRCTKGVLFSQAFPRAKWDIKRELLRTIIRVQSEGTLLDDEDQEMILRYRMGEITKAELDNFARTNAARLRAQE